MTSSTSERTVVTLNQTWGDRSGVSKIELHRRHDYGWVLWIFAEQRPVSPVVFESLAQITYDASRQFPALQCVQINELPMMSVEEIVGPAAHTALLNYRREPLR